MGITPAPRLAASRRRTAYRPTLTTVDYWGRRPAEAQGRWAQVAFRPPPVSKPNADAMDSILPRRLPQRSDKLNAVGCYVATRGLFWLVAMTQTERRLSAILHADLAGFVRLMEAAEDLTFEHLRSARSTIWQPAIEGAGGSLVHSTGDAMLAEFGSAAAAVEVAIDIQERMAQFNKGLAEEQCLLFRIGVHLGEIIIDATGHDIFGDGVNLAERIQALAEPGGIAVSRAVRDIAKLRDDYAYVDAGEHRAKHVSRPLHIYRVRARESSATVPSTSVRLRGIFHFHGSDASGRQFGFEVAMDELVRRKQSVLVGRDSDQCDVVLLNTSVSRVHARLSVGSNNTLQIEDVGSTNGISINGKPIAPGLAHPLEPESTLRLGDLELVVRCD
jgi:class 3 adenylate cyclase